MTLSLTLSNQLHEKLTNLAADEGVSVEQLAQELLAEGVTLRAWEVIEKKSAMRGQSTQRSAPNGNHRGPPGGGGGQRRGGQPNNAWMEDKAAFLEYVRNQEKGRRR